MNPWSGSGFTWASQCIIPCEPDLDFKALQKQTNRNTRTSSSLPLSLSPPIPWDARSPLFFGMGPGGMCLPDSVWQAWVSGTSFAWDGTHVPPSAPRVCACSCGVGGGNTISTACPAENQDPPRFLSSPGLPTARGIPNQWETARLVRLEGDANGGWA